MNNSKISVADIKVYQYKTCIHSIFVDTHQNTIANFQLFIQTILLASKYSSSSILLLSIPSLILLRYRYSKHLMPLLDCCALISYRKRYCNTVPHSQLIRGWTLDSPSGSLAVQSGQASLRNMQE